MSSNLFFAIDPEELAPELRDVREYWTAKRGKRPLPRRADIDPLDLRSHLPCLTLMDVMPDMADYRFRLLGTEITARFGRDSTGKLFTEAYADKPELMRWALGVFAKVATLKCPIFVRLPLVAVGKEFVIAESLYLPLSAAGERVDMILGRTRFIASTGC